MEKVFNTNIKLNCRESNESLKSFDQSCGRLFAVNLKKRPDTQAAFLAIFSGPN